MASIKRVLGCIFASFVAAFSGTCVFATEVAVSSTDESFDLVLWLVLFVASVVGLIWINSFSKKRARK